MCRVAQGACEGLTAYDEFGNIFPDRICIQKYPQGTCSKFAQSYDPADLPLPVPKYIVNVGKPSSMLAEIKEVVDGEWICPTLSVTWTSPILGSYLCFGYLLTWQTEYPGSVRMCALFLTIKGYDVPTKFKYQTSEIMPNSTYNVKVYSLPQRTISKCYLTMRVHSDVKRSINSVPGKWAPDVHVDNPAYGAALIRLVLPPAEYNFTRFLLQLIRLFVNPGVVASYYFDVKLRTHQFEEEKYSIPIYPPGVYIFNVTPVDTFQLIPTQCLCWIYLGTLEKSCQRLCRTTSTRQFVVMLGTDKQPSTSAASDELPGTFWCWMFLLQFLAEIMMSQFNFVEYFP